MSKAHARTTKDPHDATVRPEESHQHVAGVHAVFPMLHGDYEAEADLVASFNISSIQKSVPICWDLSHKKIWRTG